MTATANNNPESLADVLNVDLGAVQLPEETLASGEPPTPEHDAVTVPRRIAGLVQQVTDAKRGHGNNALNWAARLAGALHTRYPEEVTAEAVRRELIETYARREHDQRKRSAKRREAVSTVLSGWKSGVRDAAEILAGDCSGVEVVLGTDETKGEPVDNEADLLAEVRDRFPVLDLAPLVDPNRPPRRWTLEGIVPEGEQAAIVGTAGDGKSFFTLGFSICAIRGDEYFIGRRLNFPAENRVLYIDMENSEDDFSERLLSLGVDPSNVHQFQERLVVLHLPQLRGLDTQQGADDLRLILDAYGFGPGDLLVLDSTQRVTEGEENSNDTMRRLYNLTSTELKRRGLTVIRTDNTGHAGEGGKGSRARGASAKRDDVGMSWTLRWENKEDCDRDPDTQRVYSMTNTKRRAGASDQPGVFSFVHSTDEHGRLSFAPATGSTVGNALAAAHDLLAELGYPATAGVRKAWETVKQARDRALAQGEDFPKGLNSRLVQKAQSERQAFANVELAEGSGDQ